MLTWCRGNVRHGALRLNGSASSLAHGSGGSIDIKSQEPCQELDQEHPTIRTAPNPVSAYAAPPACKLIRVA